MSKRNRTAWIIGGLLLTATLGMTFSSAARESAQEREHEADDPAGRAQAMYEWYNDDYSQHGKQQARGHQKKALWSNKFERFMFDAAKRERTRYRALMPSSGTSQTVIDPAMAAQAAADSSWFNIGPTKANYEENGGTLNVTDSGRVNAIVTDPANPNTLYIGVSGGGVWKSTDGGAFWQAKTETLGSLSVGTLEMDPNNASTLYLGLGDSFDGTGIGIVKTTDGADTWGSPIILGTATVTPDIQVAPNDSNIVLVATNKGLYRSIDAGASYTKVDIATGQAGIDPYVWTITYGGIDATSSKGVFVLSLEANHDAASGTKFGQVWRSTDNGATWTQTTGLTDTAGVDRISVAAAPSNRTTMYAMATKTGGGTTDLANLFKSTDGGKTWAGIGKSGTSFKSYTNTNTESSNLGTLLNGQGWYNHVVLVDPTNANVAYFGGALLAIKTSDGGTSYKQISNWLAQFSLPYVHADFHASHIASNGTLYFGSDGGIFRSTDAGATFTHTLNEGIASHLVYQVGSSLNNRDAVIVGLQDNGTRVRETNTSIFNQQIGGDGFGVNINRANANLMLGSLYYSRIYKSTNAGLDFASACSGITECNNSSTAPFITRVSEWKGDATGNTLFTFSNTKVYKSTNYAGSWTALGTSGLPTSPALFIRNVSAAPSSNLVIGIVANSGRVLLTTNGGTSWAAPTGAMANNGNSLSSISFDQTDRNIVYVASVAPDSTKTHIWRSTDFGATWAAIDTSASGFPNGVPVNNLIIDPVNHTTLYAATHLGVYRSTDSGSTWARYGTGMPLVNVTDLYIAADGSLVRAATFGRSVWELQAAANQAPTANFTFTTSNLTATFTDGSTDSDGSIASRSWDFGDSTTSTTTSPSHTYAAAGTYNVSLTVTDNGGATNTVTKSVTVTAAANTPPTANFTFTTSNLTATFTDSSTDSDGSLASRSWDFGDSTTSTTTSPSHTYAAAGTYNVTLTVTDNGGATNSKTQSVTVTAPSGNVLQNGVTVTNLTATAGNSVNYTMDVPAGATNLTFTIANGTGDADLYVKFGSAPTDTVYDCRPYKSGNAESCTFAAPSAGTYYVRVKAYSTYSGVSLTGSYTAACTSNCAQTYTNNTAVAIPDNNATGVTSSITVSGRSGNAPSNASISVNITHTYVGDLKLDLIAPDGTVYNLRSNTGGSADNIVESYTKDLSSEALNGTWKLKVVDNAAADTGTINSWSIAF